MIFIFVLLAFAFFVLLKENEYKRSNFVKTFILFSLIVMPFFSSFFPKFMMFGIYLRLPLIFAITYFIIAIVYFTLYPFKLKIPKYAIWFFIYIAFSIFNNLIQNSYRIENWVTYNLHEYIFPLAFIILIENLKYDENDIKRLIKILSIIIIGTFVVSIIQFTINPSFYSSVNITDISATLHLYNIYGNLYRYYSLFSGLKAADCVFAIGYLFVIFLFSF